MDQIEEGRSGQKRGLTTIAVVVVIALIAVSVMLFSNKKEGNVAATTPAASPSASPTVASAAIATSAASAYKDGSYNAAGTYTTPGGTEMIKVNLTIKDGAVTASNVISGAQNPQAVRYQSDFISGYKQFVEGKKLDDIAVSNVSGSSLTPKGFADALTKIKNEAKA